MAFNEKKNRLVVDMVTNLNDKEGGEEEKKVLFWGSGYTFVYSTSLSQTSRPQYILLSLKEAPICMWSLKT